MSIEHLTDVLQYPADLVALFAAALGGAFLAVRKDFDLFGTILMAEAGALGGAVFRDLVIGVTPSAFTDAGYYASPVLAAALVYFSTTVQRWQGVFDVADAGALGLFSVGGAIKALAHGFGPLPAAALGLGCGVGGGIIAGVMAREIPSVLRWNQDLYVVPALAGAGTTALLHHLGHLNVLTALCAAGLTFALRLLSVRFGWRTPRSATWRTLLAGLRQQPTLPAADAETTVRIERATDPAPPARPAALGRAAGEQTVQLRLPGVLRDGPTPARHRAGALRQAVPHPVPDPRLPLMDRPRTPPSHGGGAPPTGPS
ncbi:trimeric intracellular cation channel family protein [Streptomyces lomondensis]|uniref:Glycine transporter domain-containing protein n=1 Tax=Streptomyces lomondensis TaxID=68229 RepID=A0ABQ2XTR1_9ACTN|nr:TRIC cation channel family protein [Streptomyces lomondensis]MCF0082718.1 TRIC cation channel family protein [Streptomyces lomondensis]GGX32191.1 hypothetical protein GCM10010383_73100 [Streptomyces lomondensis]